MRKTLLTTTALAFTAGSAAAGVSLSGSAEMGIAGSKDESTRFHTDVNVSFALSGETDGGITFSSSINLEKVDNEDGGATDNDDDDGGIAIAIGAPFGNVTLGDTDGAFDWALTETAVGGSLRDNHTGHPGYNGNNGLDGTHDGQILRYDHSIGDIGIALSAELADSGGDTPNDGSMVFGVGAKYSMAMNGGASVGVGFGYQRGDKDMEDYAKNYSELKVSGIAKDSKNRYLNDNRSAIGASVNMASGGGLSAILNWSKVDHEGSRVNEGTPAVAWDSSTSVTHFGFGVGYTAGLMTVGANWGSNKTEFEIEKTQDRTVNHAATREIKATGIGLAANYDLGGGASLQLGVGNGTTETTDAPAMTGSPTPGPAKSKSKDENTWSLGLAFSF